MVPPLPDAAAIAGWCRHRRMPPPSPDGADIAGCPRSVFRRPGRSPDGRLVGLVRAGRAGRLAGPAPARGRTGFHPSGPSAGLRGAPVPPGRRAPARRADARATRGHPTGAQEPSRRLRAARACQPEEPTIVPTPRWLADPALRTEGLAQRSPPGRASRQQSPPGRDSRHSRPSEPRFSPLVPAGRTSGEFVGCQPTFPPTVRTKGTIGEKCGSPGARAPHPTPRSRTRPRRVVHAAVNSAPARRGPRRHAAQRSDRKGGSPSPRARGRARRTARCALPSPARPAHPPDHDTPPEDPTASHGTARRPAPPRRPTSPPAGPRHAPGRPHRYARKTPPLRTTPRRQRARAPHTDVPHR
jgi:hypothetical protein